MRIIFVIRYSTQILRQTKTPTFFYSEKIFAKLAQKYSANQECKKKGTDGKENSHQSNQSVFLSVFSGHSRINWDSRQRNLAKLKGSRVMKKLEI